MGAQLESVSALVEGKRILLGYSMGARLALHLALRSDQRVQLDGLILIGGSPGIQGEADRAKRMDWDHDQATILERQGTETFMDRWSRLSMMESQRRHMTEESFREMRQRRSRGDALALAASLRGFGRGAMPDCWSGLNSLTVPTLLITGEQDERHRLIAQRMADALPTSQRLSIPTSGHAPHLENAVCLAPILNTWIAALP